MNRYFKGEKLLTKNNEIFKQIQQRKKICSPFYSTSLHIMISVELHYWTIVQSVIPDFFLIFMINPLLSYWLLYLLFCLFHLSYIPIDDNIRRRLEMKKGQFISCSYFLIMFISIIYLEGYKYQREVFVLCLYCSC